MTEPTKKIPTTAIEHVRRAIQMAPDCTTKEVTKLQAIQALIADIQQMQSKGYDWKAIASLLSEHGIAVNVVTLKSYLQRAKAGRSQSPPQAQGRPRCGQATCPRVRRGHPWRRRKGTGSGHEGRERATAAPPAAGASSRIPVGGAKATHAPGNDAISRRSAFVPEEDTDDL